MADITITQEVREVNITIEQNGQSYELQPVLVVNGGGGGGGAVDSVNGQIGVVVLDTDDIADTATNRYTNDTDATRLANTSGTNTGDQDLTPYALKSNVLELDNTTVFTPTLDYNPATKKYVDDNAGGSTTIESVFITTAEYTLLEADIEAFKIFVIQDVVATENVTITIPTTALTGVQFINIRHKGGGNTTIIPSSGVNQIKYESSSEKAITLVSDTANVWELSRGEAIASTYVAPVGATPTFVRGYNALSTTDNVIITGLTPTLNNFLLATVTFYTGGETITTPAGWTLIEKDETNFPMNAVFYKISDGTETDVTFVCSANTANINYASVYEYNGVNTTTPYEGSVKNLVVDAVSAPVPALTTTAGNRLGVAFIMNVLGRESDGVASITQGYTLDYQSSTSTGSDSWQLAYSQSIPSAATIPEAIITFINQDRIATGVLALIPE